MERPYGASQSIPGEIENPWERSRERWRATQPTGDLTWGVELSGDNFISKVRSYGAFAPDKTIFEIGPGYGRLLKSCYSLRVPFQKYVSVDLSETNVNYLTRTLGAPHIHFLQGDVESCRLPDRYDVMLSSLTLKHLYPSFEAGLLNVADYANQGAMFFFDLLEGEGSSFEMDGITYIRRYSPTEVTSILDNISLTPVAFDTVEHDPDHVRMLVVARKG